MRPCGRRGVPATVGRPRGARRANQCETAMRGLSGKAAVVTGGATLIGNAVVRGLCERGVGVAVADIDADGRRAARRRARRRCAVRDDGHPRRRGDRALLRRRRRSIRRDRLPGQPRDDLCRRGLRVDPRGLARVRERQRRLGGDDGEGRTPSPRRARRRRDRELHLDLGQGRPDGALAVPGAQGGARAAHAQHGDGPGGRRHSRQLRVAGVDVVEGDGGADGG